MDSFLSPAVCIPEEQPSDPAENIEYTYNLYLPYSLGTVISSKVDPVILEKNNFSEKTGLSFFSADHKNIRHLAQYTQVLMDNRQVKTTSVYYCQLQI